MRKEAVNVQKQAEKKGGIFFPALCRALAVLLLSAVFLFLLLTSLPRLLGYETYSVDTGSMEPALPKGSFIWIERTEPESIEAGEILAFTRSASVVVHRAVENRTGERSILTKGDANDTPDPVPVPYSAVIGRLKLQLPLIGPALSALTGRYGKWLVLAAAVCGVLLNRLASDGDRRRRDSERSGDENQD